MGKLFKILQHLFVFAILVSSIVQYHHHISDGSGSALCLLHVEEDNGNTGCDKNNGHDYSDDGCPLHLEKVCRLQSSVDYDSDEVIACPVVAVAVNVGLPEPVLQNAVTIFSFCEALLVKGSLPCRQMRAPPFA